jgi:hypothetical protein
MKKFYIPFIVILMCLSMTKIVFANPGDAPTGLEAKKEETDKKIYTLLAPIGNLTCIDTSGQDPKCAEGSIGGYFNLFFKLGLGLCAVLAVIMIIINAIKYMGGDSVFNKEEGKHGMTAALFGLLIALGSYALLNTINPDLLGGNGLTVDPAIIELDEEPILSDPANIPRGAAIAQCGGGIVEWNGFNVCADIKTNLEGMITAANAANIRITGSGYRTRAQQQALYDKHCKNGPPSCKPPTAPPGQSMHESGKAFDLKCDGILINVKTSPNTKKCFDWLKTNASRWGFKNLASENWHWSETGR